jgi:hypothetical protein
MCRLGACGPPWPNEQAAYLTIVFNSAQPGFQGELELRFASSTDATVGNTGTACAGWSGGSAPVASSSSPTVTIPRAVPSCNTWGASTQWDIFEPEPHNDVLDKFYGNLFVVQNEDRLITRVDYDPGATLYCLGDFSYTIDTTSGQGANTVTIRGNREAPCGCPVMPIPGVDPVNPDCFMPQDRNYDTTARRPHEFKMSRSTWRADTGCVMADSTLRCAHSAPNTRILTRCFVR